VVSNPLRRIRVVVSRFTRPTEPSYGTVCMNVKADSPGSAWMSSKTLSPSKSSVPAVLASASELSFANAPPLDGVWTCGDARLRRTLHAARGRFIAS
jgi:hypothetical protein